LAAPDHAASPTPEPAHAPTPEQPAAEPIPDGVASTPTVTGSDASAGGAVADPERVTEELAPGEVAQAPESPLDAPPEDKDKKKKGKGHKADPNRSKPTRALPRVLAVANQKGGVGKTTTTVNLGAALAERGYRVLVIDLDPQGNATTGLGIERRNFENSMYDVIMREHPLEDVVESTSVKNLFVAPATLDLSGVDIELVSAFSREARLKRAIEPILDDFDFIMIDCPPSLGLITINALTAAKEVLVPIQCEYYALEGLTQLRSTLQLVGSNLNEDLEMSTIVLTMYDSRTNLSSDVANDVRSHFPDEVCDTIIPRTVRLSEAPSFGQPITVFDPQSRGAKAYRDLAKEVANGAPKRSG
jgi:chromosome partitioning protein